MRLGLTGKVALVTGGGRGLGRAIALALAAEGARIAITGFRDPAAVEETVALLRGQGTEALGSIGDVRQEADVAHWVKATVEAFGGLDILVANAGVTGPRLAAGPLTDVTEEAWDEVLDSHLKGTFLSLKHVAPLMMRRGWGRIVCLSSIHGRVGGRHGLGPYGAAKAGVIALAKTAARELGPHGITVNIVAPGFIRTEALEQTLPLDRQAVLRQQVPVGRLGEPMDIGAAVAFLASEAAGFINGAILDVNGGRLEYTY